MTPRAAARAWREPSVRFWWVTSAILLAIAIYLFVSGLLDSQREKRLITEGLAIDATVESIDNLAVAGAQRPVESQIGISYTVNGQTYRDVGPPPAPRALVTVKEKIPIHVDPDDPRVWTARAEPAPLASKLIGPAIALGIMLVTLAIAWFRRRRIARIWREGAARPAAIVKVHSSGFAPLSYALDCSLSDTRDRSVQTVYLPQRLGGKPQAGEAIWLIVHPRWPRSAVAAAAFEAGSQSTGAAGAAGVSRSSAPAS